MATQQEVQDLRLVRALELGLRKARELGYETEKMKVTLSLMDGICIAYFETIAPPGQALLGGDLTITIDVNSQKVINFERGQ